MTTQGITVTTDSPFLRGINFTTYTGTGASALIVQEESISLENTYRSGTSTGQAYFTDALIILDESVGSNPRIQHRDNTGNSDIATEFVRCAILVRAPTTGVDVGGTKFVDTNTKLIDNTHTSTIRSYLNAEIINTIFSGWSVWQIEGTPSVVSRLTVDSMEYGIRLFAIGRVDLFGVTITNSSDADINHLEEPAETWMWNCVLDTTKMWLVRTTSRHYEGHTIAWQFKDRDTSAAIEDVKVVFKDDFVNAGSITEKAEYVTDSNGRLTGTYDSQNRTTGSDESRPILFVVTTAVVNVTASQSGSLDYPVVSIGTDSRSRKNNYDIETVNIEIEVRAYGHLSPSGYRPGDSFSISNPIGVLADDASVEAYQDFFLTEDETLSQTTAATVAAYTTLETVDKLYDRVKYEWYANDGYPRPYPTNAVPDFGSTNLIFDGDAGSAYAFSVDTITVSTNTGSLTLAAGSNHSAFITTGTVTFRDGAAPSGITITGDVVLDDVIDISNVTINGDLTINTAGEYDFTDVTVTGDTTNTDATGNVVINLNGGSITSTEEGTGNDEVQIVQSATVTVANLVAGTEVYAFTGSPGASAVQIAGTESSGTSFAFSQSVAGQSGFITINNVNYEHRLVSITYSANDQEVDGTQVLDENYENPA